MEDTIKLWFKEGYTDFDSSEGLNRGHPFELKRLNIIVGANNSGKSRFMRAFGFNIINKVDLYPSDNFLESVDGINNSFKTISTINLKLESLTGTDCQSIREKIQNAIMAIKDIQKQYKDLTDGSMVIFDARNRVLQHIHSSMNSNPAQFNVKAQDFIRLSGKYKIFRLQ